MLVVGRMSCQCFAYLKLYFWILYIERDKEEINFIKEILLKILFL